MSFLKKANTRFAICFIAYTCIYFARFNLSIASPTLIDEGVFDAGQIGLLGSIFSVVFATGRLFNGSLSDRVLPWIMICTGLIAVGCSNLLCGMFPAFIGMAALWGINAWAQSMLWSSELCVVCSIYDEKMVKKRTAQLVTSTAVGNLVAILFNTWLVSSYGTRYAFIVPGAINVLMAPVVWYSIHQVRLPRMQKETHMPLLPLIGHKDVRSMLAPALFHGVMKDNISLWMAVYFVSSFGIDLKQSAWFMLLIPSIGLVGRLMYPSAMRMCRDRENIVSVGGFIICAFATLVLAFDVRSPLVAALCLSITYAAISLINTSSVSIYPMRFAQSGNVAAVSGIMDFATYLGAGIGSAVYGYTIQWFGYGAMFGSWVVLSLLSMLVLLRNERRSNAER